MPAFAAAAERAAAALSCYEEAPAPAVPVAEGHEPDALLQALRAVAGLTTPGGALAECEAYSKDFQVRWPLAPLVHGQCGH